MWREAYRIASHSENCCASLRSCWMNSVRCFRFFWGLSRSLLSPLLKPEAFRWIEIESCGLALIGWKMHCEDTTGGRAPRRHMETTDAIVDTEFPQRFCRHTSGYLLYWRLRIIKRKRLPGRRQSGLRSPNLFLLCVKRCLSHHITLYPHDINF